MNEQINYFLQKYNITLNEQQKRAVCETDGAVLLLAVPGSGKTTVLVTRLGYMLYEKGIPPENILTMTYTVAAANDMKRRFVSIFGEEYADRLQFRTINGVCQSIINSYSNTISSRPSFELVTDEKRLAAILTDVYRELLEEYPAEGEIKEYKTKITYAKNMMLSDEEIKYLGPKDAPYYEMYTAYNDALRARRLMDYDDQLKYALSILKTYKQILNGLHSRFTHICVDEAQDTSKIQHEIIKLLASGSGNLFMVGDEDQSIYGFRAAYPQALLDFEKTYPNAKTLFIEENFRSDADIVRCADRFIARNGGRKQKHMTASHGQPGTVNTVKLASVKAQYSYLLRAAEECTEQTAVLYKDNETAIPLIDMLERAGVEYSLKSSDYVFFSHRIVRDIRDIITFALDGTRSDLFLRFYIRLGLYIKKDVAAAAAETAEKTGRSILSVLSEADIPEYMRGKVRSLLSNFASMNRENASKALFRIENPMGYADGISGRETEQRKLTILELLAKDVKDISSFLSKLDALNELIKNKKNTPGTKFILSTVHSAKGLEYDNVYIADAYNGIFPEALPDRNAGKEEKELFEEERRLFYVAATRAKRRLTVFTFAYKDSLFAEEFFDLEKKRAGRSKAPDGKEPITAPWKPFAGEFIWHKTYGRGKVTSVSEDDRVVTVLFLSGEKRLLTEVLLSNGIIFREQKET